MHKTCTVETGITAKKPCSMPIMPSTELKSNKTKLTTYMRHALWTGITAKKPGVLN